MAELFAKREEMPLSERIAVRDITPTEDKAGTTLFNECMVRSTPYLLL